MQHTHQRLSQLPFTPPQPPLTVALIEPEIPPNTGAIARLCAATGSRLRLVGQLGFRLDNARLRRAGLDYWEAVDLERLSNTESLLQQAPPATCHFFSTGGQHSYAAVHYRPGDTLVFGSETSGLPDSLLSQFPERVRAIPIRSDCVRSLNLATAVAIVLYEALRQICPPGQSD